MRIQVFSWLLLISLFQILYVVQVSSQCLDDQRLLLLQLKSSLVFDSEFSTKLVNWRPSADCCNWDGVVCDSSGHVIRLDLENESISGGIESSTGLFGLQYLEKLNLALNIFNGTQIPKGLQNLTNLAYLNLSNAGFGRQVPIEVSKMKNLISLDLSSLFQGVQPLKLEKPNLQMLVDNLMGLKELYLDGVDISAQKSDWCQALSSSLPNLTTLSMRYCGLSGPLDSSLSQLHSLSVLRLDGNNLSTTVPYFFAKFANLTTLTLSSCFLQGPFPEFIFQVPTLQTLDLSYNWLLSGTIPQFPVNSSLRTMVLSFTNFSGPLPDSICNLKMLSNIDVSNCEFSGVIPSRIVNLTELVYLDFSVNFFTGSIPLFHMSQKLTYIDLGRNSLTGSLSSKHFGGLSSLVNINLANNLLSGSISPSLFGLPSLQKLQLSNNKFSGQIDEFSTSNLSILVLDLSSNKLEGSIPKSFCKLGQLNVLSLSSNFFNGTIKLEMIQKLGNLTRLELGYNNLSVDTSSSDSSLSQLPQLSMLNLASCNLYNFPDLRNQSNLAFLDLSNNHLMGEIPSWIWNIGDGETLLHLNLSCNLLVDLQKPLNVSPSLVVLDLHSNSLQGELPMPPPSVIYVDYSSNNFQQPIPVEIGNYIFFTLFFSLANNGFSGTIPASLCNATYLQVLDLSSNNLTGSIPPCLGGESTSLGVLNLRRNNLRGDIPDTFSVYCSLNTLDLSNNNLGGKVPLSLANCKSLEVMNVGNNKIDDTFPCMLKNSSSLRVLVLRNNKFHGEVRCSGVNENWPSIQIVDIASNNFSGELHPRCLASWRGMVLDNDVEFRALRFEFLKMSNFYYQDTVTVMNKGLEMKLIKILTVFKAVDLSCNNFIGEIPKTVGELSSLYVLNLSHNSFIGTIPSSTGNLKQLGSLDLSMNQLTGEIPQELTSLTFLSFLNLSYNKLFGGIPNGPQFQTFTEESFVGNSGLCGFPLNTICDTNEPAGESTPSLSKREFNWEFILAAGLGYEVGVLSFFASLVFFDQWRQQFNKQVDKFLDLILPRH